MAQRIRQSFLHDTVDRAGKHRRQIVEASVQRKINARGFAARRRSAAGECAQAFRQLRRAGAPGAQAAEQVADDLHESAGTGFDALHVAEHRWIVERGTQGRRVRAQRAQVLAEFIVQLAGERVTLVFLHRE